MDAAANPREFIGANNPPPDSPFEIAAKEITDLYDEASMWCDGAPVTSQDQADGLSNLLNMIRAARKRADEARVAEKRPHDEAAAAVQVRYRPILGNADLAADACKKALAPWLAKVEAEAEDAAEKARSEAEHTRQLAAEAFQSSDVTNLADRARAEALLVEAKRAERQAKRAENVKPQAGHFGRAVSLRRSYQAAMVSERDALAHYWRTDRVSVVNALQALADQDVRAGVRTIPGFRIDEVKQAV